MAGGAAFLQHCDGAGRDSISEYVAVGGFSEQGSIATYWHNKANDLYNAARVLSENGQEKAVFRMLCGMSLEAILKAIVVETRQVPRKSHNLNQLSRDAGLSYDVEQQKLLQILTEAIVWDGRYPVPNDEQHWDELIAMKRECLFDKERPGKGDKLTIFKPSNKLSWESFEELWSVATEKLFAIANWVIREL